MSSDNTSSGKVIVNGFGSGGDDEKSVDSLLKWYCAPDSWESTDPNLREGKDGWWKIGDQGRELVIAAPAKKDFWRKTYYQPVMVKDDGPCLYATLPRDRAFMIETSLILNGPNQQFDQGGIYVRIDGDHWIKTGIEMVDGLPRLSCVVTNVYSDWSTQTWHEPQARLRVHIFPNRSLVVEAAPVAQGATEWSFVRIAHLSESMHCTDDALDHDPAVKNAWKGPSAPPGHLFAGVFACCPEDQAGSFVAFHDFSIVEGSSFKHDADCIHE